MATKQHPVKAAGGTSAHVKAFEQIAIGQTPRCLSVTLEWLLNHDFIEKRPDKIVGRDRFGPIGIPQYEVPIWAHMAWCEWAAAQGKADRC